VKHTPTLLLVVAAAVVAGCTTSSTVTSGPDPVKCQVSVASPATVDAGGGTGSLAITTQPECAWDASTTASWISGMSPASGQGAANVAFRVAPNDGTSSREAMIVVNGEQARVSQRAPCRFAISPASLNVSAAGGTGNVNVATLSECAWTATTDVNWITATSSTSGSGNGTVGFTVAPNSGDQRVGSIIIAGERATVTQAGVSVSACTSTITPTSQNVAATGGTVAVSVQSRCGWTASSQASWITVTSGSTGTGNGSVTFNVAANTGASRSGSLTIAGRAFSVAQAGASGSPAPPPPSCTFSISPSSHNFQALGGRETVDVNTQSGCQWTASSSAAWILILSGASGTGDGEVELGIAPNLGAARTGTVTIGGRTFTATQATVAPCSYSISPNKQDLEARAGIGTVEVNTTSNCAWTATSDESWITITFGTSGTGDGTVTFTVSANTGNKRKGTLTVAGRRAEVEQEDGR
jgi:Viral BACON domain/Putative binding domain, N-terminal